MLAADTLRNSVLSLEKYKVKKPWEITTTLYISTQFYHLPTFQVQFESTLGINTMSLPREKWDTWDPTLISEVTQSFLTWLDLTWPDCRACLRLPTSSPPWSWSTSSQSTLTWALSRYTHISTSNILTLLTSMEACTSLFAEIRSVLLQVILSRMILDICKFCFLYVLVLFAFSCGENFTILVSKGPRSMYL